jgi:hypothetical protein
MHSGGWQLIKPRKSLIRKSRNGRIRVTLELACRVTRADFIPQCARELLAIARVRKQRIRDCIDALTVLHKFSKLIPKIGLDRLKRTATAFEDVFSFN